MLLLCGDLTDYGLPEEAALLAGDASAVKIPVLAVVGNHDFESGHLAEVEDILDRGGCRSWMASRAKSTESDSPGFADLAEDLGREC